jgi:hypothetical protein
MISDIDLILHAKTLLSKHPYTYLKASDVLATFKEQTKHTIDLMALILRRVPSLRENITVGEAVDILIKYLSRYGWIEEQCRSCTKKLERKKNQRTIVPLKDALSYEVASKTAHAPSEKTIKETKYDAINKTIIAAKGILNDDLHAQAEDDSNDEPVAGTRDTSDNDAQAFHCQEAYCHRQESSCQ